MSYALLSDREKRILDHLRSVPFCGFNDLHDALVDYTSRQTLRKDLDHLINMQLVHEAKRRKGQRNRYQLGENVAKFEIGLLTSLAEWKKLENELKHLSESAKSQTFKPKKAGSIVTYLIYRAAFMTASLAFDPDAVFPINIQKGLLSFSAKKFNDFLEEVLKLGRQYPEISREFEKTSDKILKAVTPRFEDREGNSTGRIA